MKNPTTVPLPVITGIGIEFPGIESTRSLLDQLDKPVVSSKFDPTVKLGKKGLRYKDHATKLALCAAKSALEDAELPIIPEEQVEPEHFGVAASSNLGNLDTVCRVIETIHASHIRYTSALDLPNASSNVVASRIAIQFGLKQLCLMLCSGATSGINALHLASNNIRAGRAMRMLVAGVEPYNPFTQRLMNESLAAWLDDNSSCKLGDGAGAVVLENKADALARGARIYSEVSAFGYSHDGDIACSLRPILAKRNALPMLWFTPNTAYEPTAAAVSAAKDVVWGCRSPVCIDISKALGETYGAMGVLQCIAASQWLHSRPEGMAVATSGSSFNEGCASLLFSKVFQ